MRESENIVMGKSPLMEAFNSDITIERVFIKKGLNDSSINSIIKKSKARGVRPEFVSKERLDEMCFEGNHQGVCAFVSAFKYYEVEDMLKLAKDRNEPPFLILLDGIEDPQNLGAIIRSANLLGAHGVIIEKRRSATLTNSAAKASAGAVLHTYVARVTNLKNTMEMLKDCGLWFVCSDISGKSMYEVDFKGPLGLVVGNEGKGVSRLIKENCDFFAKIPMYPISGDVDSYNASVALGILGAEAVRQRREK